MSKEKQVLAIAEALESVRGLNGFFFTMNDEGVFGTIAVARMLVDVLDKNNFALENIGVLESH